MCFLKQRLAAIQLTVSLGTFILTCGCATYQANVEQARIAIVNGDFNKAVSDLKPLAAQESKDQLVYLLDYGVATQLAGDYQESNKVFLYGDRLADQLDYHSVSKVATSLALNEEMVQYKGDTFEKIFINAYLAMNYLQLGNLEDALVEARRMNEKYQKYRTDEKKQFELNFFGKYLSALIWEANQNYDDAYIAYSEAYKIDPNILQLKEDLIRTSRLAKRNEANREWKKKFPELQSADSLPFKKQGELVVIFQQGWGPRKYPGQDQYRFPVLYPIYSQTQRARLCLAGRCFVSSVVYDVEQAAISTLKEDQGILLAKRLAGIATKAVLADQMRQKNQLLGDLTWIALNVADRADLRQWSTLPQTIQIIRVPLDPGFYNFNLEGIDSHLNPTGESYGSSVVEIKAGKKNVITWRSLK